MKFLISLSLLLSFSLVSFAKDPPAQKRKAACQYGVNCDCAAPGDTDRWGLAICGAIYGTDDYEIENVQKCTMQIVSVTKANNNPCDHNKALRRLRCAQMNEDGPGYSKCLKEVPGIIATGIGG